MSMGLTVRNKIFDDWREAEIRNDEAGEDEMERRAFVEHKDSIGAKPLHGTLYCEFK